MYIEYYINSIDEKDIEIKNTTEELIKLDVKNIVGPYSQIKFIRKLFNHLNLGCFVDYPNSFSDPSKRQELIIDSLKIGSNFISITLPFYWIINRKYDRLREDIKKNFDLCKQSNVDIRYILEYRKFDHSLLAKICEILVENNINIIYPSTGFFVDNLDDSIIAASYLKQKTGIDSIINANIWTNQHIDAIIKSDHLGISCNNIVSLKLIHNHGKQ